MCLVEGEKFNSPSISTEQLPKFNPPNVYAWPQKTHFPPIYKSPPNINPSVDLEILPKYKTGGFVLGGFDIQRKKGRNTLQTWGGAERNHHQFQPLADLWLASNIKILKKKTGKKGGNPWKPI